MVTNTKRPLCYAPFINSCIKQHKHKPCCIYKDYHNMQDENYWSSQFLQDIRRDMLNHKFPEGCSICKSRINMGLDSDISLYDEMVDKYMPDINPDIISGNQSEKPIIIDFRPSNICNLKCRMCHYSSSNQIAIEIINNDELKDFFKIYKNIEGNKKLIFQSSERVFDWIHKVEPKEIKFLGGEPSVDESVIRLIKLLPKNTKIKMTTNLATLNNNFKNELKTFKKVKLRISVDSIGTNYEYIRTNASWLRFENNLNYILKQKNIRIGGVNIVLMPYNIFYIKDTIQYFINIRDIIVNEDCEFNFSIVNSNDETTGISAILPEHKDQVIDELKSVRYLDEKVFNDVIQLLENNKFEYDNYTKFIKYNNILDKIRKTNLLLLDERFKKYV